MAFRRAHVDRYGEWILLRPPASGLGSLVWGLPAAGAVLGGGGLALVLWRWRRAGTGRPSDADRDLVAAALDPGPEAGLGSGE